MLTEEAKSIIKVASIYVTTIIGAGFASGQEIVQFFSTYHKGGFYGIILAGILFGVIGCIVLDKVYRERIRDYDEFLFPTVGWLMGWVMEVVVALFMVSVFCVMIAGMGNIFAVKLGFPFHWGIIAMTLICMIIILTDIKGVAMLSSIVAPILVIGITGMGLYIILYRDTSVFSGMNCFGVLTHNWFFSALLYVSYNSLMSVVVMCSLLPYLKSRKVGPWGGILGGALLCLIALILNSAIFMFYPDVLSKELPVVSIVEKYNGLLSGLYSFILVLAMLASAVTAGYCFINRTSSKIRVNAKLVTVLFCLLAVPLSSFGFANLIATVYPIFGYLGMFMVFAILIQAVRIKPGLLFKRKK